jgi:hypothetical protein
MPRRGSCAEDPSPPPRDEYEDDTPLRFGGRRQRRRRSRWRSVRFRPAEVLATVVEYAVVLAFFALTAVLVVAMLPFALIGLAWDRLRPRSHPPTDACRLPDGGPCADGAAR